MHQFFVYLYKDPKTNNIVYVGKGKGKRANCHKSLKTRLGSLIRKRIKEGFVIEPQVFIQTDEATAFAMEQALISWYGREDLDTGTLFNLTDGGEGVSGYKPNPADVSRRRALLKGRPGKSHSADTKSKLSNINKGKIIPKEVVEKIQATKKERYANRQWVGHSQTEETKAKIGASSKGKPRSPEVRAKISASRKATELRKKLSKNAPQRRVFYWRRN